MNNTCTPTHAPLLFSDPSPAPAGGSEDFDDPAPLRVGASGLSGSGANRRFCGLLRGEKATHREGRREIERERERGRERQTKRGRDTERRVDE